MKPEEAKKHMEWFQQIIQKAYSGTSQSGCDVEPFFASYKALDRMIGQKPITNEDGHEEGLFTETTFCPSCNSVVRKVSNDFCGHCGQKIDWGK